MKRSEIYLAKFPLAGTVGVKIRPVLLLTDPVGSVTELLTAYISSVIPAAILPSDVILDPNSATNRGLNLKTFSVLRLHKLSTLHRSDAVRFLGRASPAIMQEVDNRLRVLLAL